MEVMCRIKKKKMKGGMFEVLLLVVVYMTGGVDAKVLDR